VFAVLGTPGIGKSALAATLCGHPALNVRAGYFAGLSAQCGDLALGFVRSVAGQLAAWDPDYCAALHGVLDGDEQLTAEPFPHSLPCVEPARCPSLRPKGGPLDPQARCPTPAPPPVACAARTAAALWDRLVTNPLARAQAAARPAPDSPRPADRHQPGLPVVVVLDGIDPLQGPQHEALAELVRTIAERNYRHLRLLVTVRVGKDGTRDPAHCQVKHLVADDPNNVADLRSYVDAVLKRPEVSRGHSAASVEAAIDRLTEAADGVFLYPSLVFADRERLDTLFEPGAGTLPKGLQALYRKLFLRHYPDAAAYSRQLAPLLEVLVASRGPMPLRLLLEAAGVPGGPGSDEWWAARRALAPFFVGSGRQELRPFHKSLRTWLVSEHAREFGVSAHRGHQALAAWGAHHQATLPIQLRSYDDAMRSYLTDHLTVHARKAGTSRLYQALLADKDFCRERARWSGLGRLVADLRYAERHALSVSPGAAAGLLSVLPQEEGSSASERRHQELRGELHAAFGPEPRWPRALREHLADTDVAAEVLFRAFTYDMERRYTEAYDVYRELQAQLEHAEVVRDPTRRWLWRLAVNGRAAALGHAGRTEEAREVLEVALSDEALVTGGDADRAWLLYHLGIVLLHLDDLDGAAEALQEALAEAGGSALRSGEAQAIETSASHQIGVLCLRKAAAEGCGPERLEELLRQAMELFEGCRRDRERVNVFNHRMAFEQRRLGNACAALAELYEARAATLAETPDAEEEHAGATEEAAKQRAAAVKWLRDALRTSHDCGHLRYLEILLKELDELAPEGAALDEDKLRSYREALKQAAPPEELDEPRRPTRSVPRQLTALHFWGGSPAQESPLGGYQLTLYSQRLLADELHGDLHDEGHLQREEGRLHPPSGATEPWLWLVRWSDWRTLLAAPASGALRPEGPWTPPPPPPGPWPAERPAALATRKFRRLTDHMCKADPRVPLQALHYRSVRFLQRGLARTWSALHDRILSGERCAGAGLVAVRDDLFGQLWDQRL